MADKGKCDEADQANNTQGNKDIEDGFAQAHLHYKCFELVVVVYCIVLDIKHDTQYGDEHEVFYEEEEAYEGRFKDKPLFNAVA